MIRHCKVFLALGLGLVASGCMTARNLPPPTPRVSTAITFNPSSYATLGVYLENQSGSRYEEGVLRSLEDEFMRAVLQGGYSLASRSDIERLVREQRLQSSSVTEEAIARLGRTLNVPAIIIVTVNSISTSTRPAPMLDNRPLQFYRTVVEISARLIGAERGEVLWLASHTHGYNFDSSDGDRREMEGRALRHVAGIVASGLPPRVP